MPEPTQPVIDEQQAIKIFLGLFNDASYKAPNLEQARRSGGLGFVQNIERKQRRAQERMGKIIQGLGTMPSLESARTIARTSPAYVQTLVTDWLRKGYLDEPDLRSYVTPQQAASIKTQFPSAMDLEQASAAFKQFGVDIDQPTTEDVPGITGALPPGLLSAIPKDDLPFVQSLMAKRNAKTSTVAEENLLDEYLGRAFTTAYGKTGFGGVGGAGADDALGWAQFGESQRQFDISQAFARERERNALEDALSKLRMRGVEAQQSNLGNMMQFQQSLAPFALPQGTQYIPGNEPGGYMERLGLPRVSPVSYDLSPYMQQVQQGTQGAINPLLQYIQSQQGGQ